MSGIKTWKKAEAEKPLSKTPRVDDAMEGIIIDPSQRIYKVVKLAREFEIELSKQQTTNKNLAIIAKSATHDKRMATAKPVYKKKQKPQFPINPYENLSNDEVMEKLRGFGFGNCPN